MKYVIFLILTCNNILLFGQPYKSIFGKQSTSWNIIPFGECDGTFTSTFYASEDTFYMGKTWKIFDDSFNMFDGFLREDTITGKVWYYSREYEQEYLVMDLSLQKDDIFNIIDYLNDTVTLSVDSIYFENGLKKIVFKNSFVGVCDASEEEPFQFTEGTGSNVGFFYNRTDQPPSFSKYMLCHYKDDLKVYGNKLFNDTCNVLFVSVEDINKAGNLKLFPNPTSDNVYIEFENPSKQEAELKVYNLNGKLIYVGSTFDNILEFTLKDTATHINLYVLKLNGKIVKRGKILKTN